MFMSNVQSLGYVKCSLLYNQESYVLPPSEFHTCSSVLVLSVTHYCFSFIQFDDKYLYINLIFNELTFTKLAFNISTTYSSWV